MTTSDHFYAGERCPNPECEHDLLDHVLELGCMVGWEHDENGIAQSQGCECPLTLAEQYGPPHEKEYHAHEARDERPGVPGA